MSILAKLFPGNDQVAQLEASLAESETLRADLGTAQARIEELAPLAEINAQLQADLSEVQAKLDAAEGFAAENVQALSELTAAAEVTEEKVAAKASEILAAQGHPAPVQLTGDTGDTGKTLYAQYSELKQSDPRAAAKFWDDNKAAMLAAR